MKTHIPSILPSLLLISSLCNCSSQPEVNIAADVNRDGRVDFRTDEPGEDVWNISRGAIFLNNNDSDQNTGEADNADLVVNGETDLLDLALLRLKKMPGLPENGVIRIRTDGASSDRVNLFYKSDDGTYRHLDQSTGGTIDPSMLSGSDVELYIEANSYADRSWNGETVITATVTVPGETEESDSVRLRVAPFMLLSNLHEGRTLYVRENPGRNEAFLAQLGELVPAAGADLVIIPAGEPYSRGSVWCQDALEIGYTEMPGHRMNVVLKANRNRPLDEFPKNEMLAPDYGWTVCGDYRPELRERRLGNNWLDWYGNLEVSPPVPGYPLGRIYYGSNDDESLNPEIVAMLDAQGIQGPAVKLDTGWWIIKHVDEMVCFVPTGSKDHPYKVMVPDTRSMLDLIESWISEGLGGLTMMEPFRDSTTVAEIAANTELLDHNRRVQIERIDPVIETLKREFSLRDEDFIPTPALLSVRGGSMMPNIVNSVVLNGHMFITDPHGPEVEGADLIQEYVRNLLAELPLEVHFLDDRAYHSGGGNTHCATNVRREGFREPWWTLFPPD